MVNLIDKINKLAYGIGLCTGIPWGIGQIGQEITGGEYFTNPVPLEVGLIGSVAMAAYMFISNPDSRHNKEYNSEFSKEKPIPNYTPSRLDEANKE